MAKKRLFSGIQPSGLIHIGNYLGAIRAWAEMLGDYECIFGIVDYHAITIEYDPKEMPQRILDAAAANIACGLDPERCTVMVQSHVPEHTELAWVFNSVTPMGELERMTQYKEKSQQHETNVNAGLFTYPVLQAADIALYKAEMVPVGEDQVQHVELSREIVRKFNRRYGDIFPEPQEKLSVAPRVMGLDNKSKMSKSRDNYIAMEDSAEVIWKKVAPAVTDPARKRRSDPGTPELCNIYSWHKYFSPAKQVDECAEGCRTAGIGCVDCKKVLHENMTRELAPIRERILELKADPDTVNSVLRNGAEKCRDIARETMAEVRSAMGLTA